MKRLEGNLKVAMKKAAKRWGWGALGGQIV